MPPKRILLTLGPSLTLAFGLSASPAFAQPTEIRNRALTGALTNYTGVDFLQTVIPNLITLLFVFAIIIAIVFLLYNGIRVITSAGNKDAVSKAREGIIAAVIGLVVILGLYAIVRFIEYFFDLDLLILDIGPLLLR